MRARRIWIENQRILALDDAGAVHDLAPARRYFYARRSNALVNLSIVTEGGPGFVRVYDYGRGDWLEKWRSRGVEPLEADVPAVDRLLADMPGLGISEHVSYCMLDLETLEPPPGVALSEHSKLRVVSFAWRGSDGRRGCELGADSDEAEGALLAKLARVVNAYDCILAWNGGREWGSEGFDFPIIRERSALRGVKALDWRKIAALDHLALYRRRFLVTTDGAQRSSFALDAVAKHQGIGDGKLPLKDELRRMDIAPSGAGIRDALTHAPELLRAYNARDVDLMWAIEEKTQFLRMHLDICRLVHALPRSDSLAPTRIMDALMLRLGAKMGYHWPTRERWSSERDDEKVRGALVRLVEPGLSHGVSVLDLSSLYPSIIRVLNLGPDTKRDDGPIAPILTEPDGTPTEQVIARFRSGEEPGQIPIAINLLLKKRREYESAMKALPMSDPRFADMKRLSNATKVAANAMYGIILQPGSRFYDREVGEAVTSTGRFLAHGMAAHIDSAGFRIVLQDTDSAGFVCGEDDAPRLERELNERVFPALLARCGVPEERCREIIGVKYEERYSTLLQVATKKYAGTFEVFRGVKADATTEPDIKGLECVRGDQIDLTRDLQRDVVGRILRGEDSATIRATCEQARERVLEGPLAVEEVLIRQRVKEDLAEYKGDLRHVRAAREAQERGLDLDGGKIAYWLARGGAPKLAEDFAEGDVDRALYWETIIWPPTERVASAAFPGEDWRLPAGGGAQLALFDSPPVRPRRKTAAPPAPKAASVTLLLSTDEADALRDKMRINRLVAIARENPGPVRLSIECRLDGSTFAHVLETGFSVSVAAIEKLMSAARL